MAVVRAATELDIPAITDIYSWHVRNGAATFETDPPNCAEMERRWREIVSDHLPYLVLETNAVVAGYAYAGRYRPRPAYRFTVEDSIYLRLDFQGQGLGRLLLEELIAQCEALGLHQMIAVIGDSRNLPSIRLHKRLGFRHIGVLSAVGHKFGRWVDTVLMQRPLG